MTTPHSLDPDPPAQAGADPVSMRARGRVVFPPLRWVLQKPHRLIAFGFGSGLLRPASGTWGTLLAWLLWAAFAPVRTPISDISAGLFLAVAFAYGCWATSAAGSALNASDHVGMVWDEMVAFWLVLLLAPVALSAQVTAFVLFRIFDTVKPQPIKYFDAHVKGGVGVMIDDILAAAYTLLLIAIAVRMGVWA